MKTKRMLALEQIVYELQQINKSLALIVQNTTPGELTEVVAEESAIPGLREELLAVIRDWPGYRRGS